MTTSTTKASLKDSRIFRFIIPLAFWVAIWQIAAMAVSKALLLPGPYEVLKRLLELSVRPEFWIASGLTLLRVFGGFALGVIIGTALAVLTFANETAGMLLAPVVKAVRSTPVSSFILLALLWIKTDGVPVFISMLMVMPVVWGNVYEGIKETDRGLLEMAGAYRLGGLGKAKLVYVPSVSPYFVSGCLTSMGLAWKAGVAAEILCLPKKSIGTELYFSKIYIETPSLFAWTAAVIILSLLLEKLLVKAIGREIKK